MGRGGTASDYWEDKDPAVSGLTAASTSGVPRPSLRDHHPIPSTRGNFLLPLFIYPSIHLSFRPQQTEIITLDNATTNSSLPLLFSSLRSKHRAWIFWVGPLQSVPVVEKRYVWLTQKNATGRFLVWSHLPVCQRNGVRCGRTGGDAPPSAQVFCVADGAGFELQQINETLWDNLPTLRAITDGAYEGERWARAETVAPWTPSGMAPRFVNRRAGYSYLWIFPCPQSQLAYLITHLRGPSRLREIFDS